MNNSDSKSSPEDTSDTLQQKVFSEPQKAKKIQNMVIRYNDILSIITTLGDEEKLQVTVKEVTKGGLIAGGACALGGLILGPLGFAVGGTIGGCIAAIVSSNKFKPVSTIILYEMSPDTQQRLINNVKSIISNLDAGDALELLAIIQGSPALRARILSEITKFVTGDLNLTFAPFTKKLFFRILGTPSNLNSKFNQMEPAEISQNLSPQSLIKSGKRRGPNFFVALQVKGSDILENFRSFQERMIHQDAKLKDACVPVEKSHVTLAVFHATHDTLKIVEKIVQEAVSEYRSSCNSHISYKVKGLGDFKSKVIFAKLNFSDVTTEAKFLNLWRLVTQSLFNAGFLEERDIEVSLSRSHVTLMKLSIFNNSSVRSIPKTLYTGHIDDEFGDSIFDSVQILSMSKPKNEETGYYYCEKEFELSPEKYPSVKYRDPMNCLQNEKERVRTTIRNAISEKFASDNRHTK